MARCVRRRGSSTCGWVQGALGVGCETSAVLDVCFPPRHNTVVNSVCVRAHSCAHTHPVKA